MTAKDLLYKILDYQYLWILPHNQDSKSAKLRLEQIELLLEAFELTKKQVNPLVQANYLVGDKQVIERSEYLTKLTNLQYLLGGEFLRDREDDANAEILERIIETIASLYPYIGEETTRKAIHISWLFNNLMSFRQEVYKLTYPNGGMEGFSAGLYYSFYLQSKLKTLITENLDEIDETLWLLLDPTKREIEMDILVSKYKYINHDFRAMDLDWSMENY